MAIAKKTLDKVKKDICCSETFMTKMHFETKHIYYK